MLKVPKAGNTTPSVERTPPPPTTPATKTGLDAVVANIPDSLIISSIINIAGSIVVHELLGVPYDLSVSLTFGAIGTMIGAAYGPAKDALIHQFASHSHRHGLPLGGDAEQLSPG